MSTNIQDSVEIIKNGGVILHLTDTIWGLGCDPKNHDAVKKLHQIKKRPNNKSYIILISEEGQLYNYVQKIPEIAWEILEVQEEPLTIIYPKGKNLPPEVLAEDGSIAIRLVKDKACLNLLKKLRNGLISSSANISGEKSPTQYSEISDTVLNEVDYIVTSDVKSHKKASKIIKLGPNGEFELIRK